MNEPKQNTLIPMQDPAGNRCFVNAWDVPSRKADGWTVIGDLAFHTASTRAPVELLAGKGDAVAPAAPAGDPVAAERARVRAILKAADEDQGELADKLIADGAPEADAIKALAAARKTKKPPAEKPPAAAPAPAAAAAPAK